MNLVQYNRPGNIFNLINSIFDDFPNYKNQQLYKNIPLVDIYEKNNNFFIEVQLPGIKKENINIKIENNQLLLSAKNYQEKEEIKNNYYKKEIMKGNFARSFYLPNSINKDNLIANFNNGILKIEIPKLEKKESRQISIN